MGRNSRARAAGERRMGPGRLTHGWAGPAGTVVRLARPGEAAEVARLAETTGGPLDEYMHAAIEGGTAAVALLGALRTGKDALLNPVARVATGGGDPTPMTELSLALVAERGQRIVGALYALPPGGFITQIIEQGMAAPQALITAVAAIKIKALAVEPDHRGHGIASAMLAGCVRLYDQLGYHLLYGSYAVGSGLDAFYAARGFEILPVGAGIPMDVILGRPAVLATDTTEQLFARWH